MFSSLIATSEYSSGKIVSFVNPSHSNTLEEIETDNNKSFVIITQWGSWSRFWCSLFYVDLRFISNLDDNLGRFAYLLAQDIVLNFVCSPSKAIPHSQRHKRPFNLRCSLPMHTKLDIGCERWHIISNSFLLFPLAVFKSQISSTAFCDDQWFCYLAIFLLQPMTLFDLR